MPIALVTVHVVPSNDLETPESPTMTSHVSASTIDRTTCVETIGVHMTPSGLVANGVEGRLFWDQTKSCATRLHTSNMGAV